MNDELATIEKQYADLVAAEYLGQGCQVLRDVPLEFLPGYRADMVVKDGYDITVVEVKTQPSLMANPGLREFERIINSRPGWKFKLRLVGEPERLAAVENARSLDEAGILDRLAQAQTALDAGLPEAAFLLAWTAAEAAVRMMVKAEGIALERTTNPAYVLGMAVAHGAMDRDDHRRLTKIMEYRNAIAHGFEVSDFTDMLVIELAEKVKSLLREYHEWIECAGVVECPA